MPSIRRSALLLAGERQPRELAVGQGAGASTRSTPRPRRWRCSKPPARRSPICRSSPMPGRPGIRAARPGSASGPRRSSPRFGELHPRLAEGARRAGRRGRRRNLSRRHSGAARRAAAPAPAYAPPALQAITPRLRLPRPGRRCRPTHLLRAIRGADKAAITDVRLFDRFEAAEGLSPGVRGDAAAGREELHRRADRRDLEADRRRRGEARRAPQELVRAR